MRSIYTFPHFLKYSPYTNLVYVKMDTVVGVIYILCMFSILNNIWNGMFIATSKLTNAETSSCQESDVSWVLSNGSFKYMYSYSENYYIFYIATVNVHLKFDVGV